MPEQSRSAQIELLAAALRYRSRRCPPPIWALGNALAANLKVYAALRPNPAYWGFLKQRFAEFELALFHDLGGAAK